MLRTADDPPPPAREQLPLPRRRQQAHLEPQLRNPGDAGTGTPFAAFAGESSNEDDAPADDTSAETDLAAAFLAATRRRRRYRFGD
ncbi:hypothetical protein [Pseudonocardia sp.]|uniref:hypothetical protein n=1 Tax=Pseudonocardia sp. TaxID=60912 RepID=UPI0031FC9AA5